MNKFLTQHDKPIMRIENLHERARGDNDLTYFCTLYNDAMDLYHHGNLFI